MLFTFAVCRGRPSERENISSSMPQTFLTHTSSPASTHKLCLHIKYFRGKWQARNLNMPRFSQHTNKAKTLSLIDGFLLWEWSGQTGNG